MTILHTDSRLCLKVLIIDHVILLLDYLNMPFNPDLIVRNELRPLSIESVHERTLQVEPILPGVQLHQTVQVLAVRVIKNYLKVSFMLQ